MRFLASVTVCLSVLFATCLASPLTSSQSNGTSLANTVVLIIRHAEKPETGAGLTAEGQKRAQAYVKYFSDYKINGKPLVISHLFAATDSTASQRPRLTVEPLAKAKHLKIDLRFSDKNPAEIAKDLVTHNYGRRILISWRHGKIPALLEALGADPHTFVPEGKWPGKVFDRVIELHFDAQGKIISTESHLVLEHLMPGDEK